MGARASTGPEFELAREVRDAGLKELEAKAEFVQDEFEAACDEILAPKESLVGFSRNPLGKTVNLLLASLLTLLIKSLSKRKD